MLRLPYGVLYRSSFGHSENHVTTTTSVQWVDAVINYEVAAAATKTFYLARLG